jgi:hypothetical protein
MVLVSGTAGQRRVNQSQRDHERILVHPFITG